MKFHFLKVILIGLVLFLTTSSGISIHTLSEITQKVFVCNSKGGKKYHFSKTCRGLSSCKASIKGFSIAEAKRNGKTLCGWED